MLFFGIASGCEALAAANGWSETALPDLVPDRRVWTAGWLGLGTAFLLGKTRFGYAFALCLLFAASDHVPAPARTARSTPTRAARRCCTSSPRSSWRSPWRSRPTSRTSAGHGSLPCRRGRDRTEHRPDARRPPCRRRLRARPDDRRPDGRLLPGSLRLLTPFMNVTGAPRSSSGALFSAYVFMPKRRVLGLLARPGPAGRPVPVQPGDLARRDRRELLRVDPDGGPRVPGRPDEQPRPGDGADRPRAADPGRDRRPHRVGSTDYYQLGKLVG